MNCIITLTTKNKVFYHKNYLGIMKLSPNNTNLDSIFRQILDFCFSKSAICKIPREIDFYFDDQELLKVIIDGLYHIFLALTLSMRDNKLIEFYKNRYLVENIKEIP
jgi:hypothetical protein